MVGVAVVIIVCIVVVVPIFRLVHCATTIQGKKCVRFTPTSTRALTHNSHHSYKTSQINDWTDGRTNGIQPTVQTDGWMDFCWDNFVFGCRGGVDLIRTQHNVVEIYIVVVVIAAVAAAVAAVVTPYVCDGMGDSFYKMNCLFRVLH